jgi:hypothetical protein
MWLRTAAGFDLPGNGEFVAQVVVADAGESDERSAWDTRGGELVLWLATAVDVADYPLLSGDPHQLPGLGYVRIPCAQRGGDFSRNSRHWPPSHVLVLARCVCVRKASL